MLCPCYLRQGGYVFTGFCLSVCLSVCLCVSKITQKVMDGSFWNFEEISGISYSWFNFGGDPAGILHSGSLWSFRYQYVKGGIWKPLAKRQCIQSWFLGHVELGHCGKCNYSLKRVGEIYITIWQALGRGTCELWLLSSLLMHRSRNLWRWSRQD